MMKLTCMHHGCECIAIYRGLCIRHYNRLRSLVRRKKTTWPELEAAGECAVQVRGKDGYTPATRPERTTT